MQRGWGWKSEPGGLQSRYFGRIARRLGCITSLYGLVVTSADRYFPSSANLALSRGDDNSYDADASYILLKYEQELYNCLGLVKTTWEQILDPTGASHLHLDANTVHTIQDRSLLTSSEDYHFIEKCMQDGVLFPAVTDKQQRLDIFHRLSVIPYLIPSLYTFIENTKYIEPPAKIMKKLLPPRFKGSVCQVFRRLHTGQTQIMEQQSETAFSSLSLSAEECFQVAYQQLWLLAMRRFPEMTGTQLRKDAGRLMEAITGGAKKW